MIHRVVKDEILTFWMLVLHQSENQSDSLHLTGGGYCIYKEKGSVFKEFKKYLVIYQFVWLQDFKLKNDMYDISLIPDIYDSIKYDIQHNRYILQLLLLLVFYIRLFSFSLCLEYSSFALLNTTLQFDKRCIYTGLILNQCEISKNSNSCREERFRLTIEAHLNAHQIKVNSVQMRLLQFSLCFVS